MRIADYQLEGLTSVGRGSPRGWEETSLALTVQVSLARATDLARAGKYDEAETVLAGAVGESGSHPAALDLLARIRAQQGRLIEAQALWGQASRLDPSNTT